MIPPFFESLRKDLAGGAVAASVAIPLSLGFGMFVFVTLGDAYFAYGAAAGLIAALVAGLVCVVLGERTPTIYAPRITTTFFLGLLLYSLVHSQDAGLQSASAAIKLLVLFAIMLLAGAFQALFGVFRLGTLIKFAPHPVMAGFQNMAAVLLFLVQLGNVLGYDRNVPFTQALSQIGDAKPFSVVVALVTFLAMWNARKITTRVPPVLVGLGLGLISYYGLKFAGAAVGPAIGTPPATVTVPHPYVEFLKPEILLQIAALTPTIVGGAMALALIAAIDAMLCAKLAGRRGDSDRMLIRLGLANVASAAAGGITNGLNIGATLTNKAFGGHSWISIAFNTLLLLLALWFAMPWLGEIPRAVISAVIMVIAVQHIDAWSKQAAARLFKPATANRRALALDLGVALVVSILSITVNIVLAVFIGIGIAVGLFVLRMSRNTVRRQYRGDSVRSRKARGVEDQETLDKDGAAILILELQGALFFGSAERLAQIIERETAQPTRHLILDLRRVTEVDSTSVRILGEIDGDLKRRGIVLSLVAGAQGVATDSLAALPTQRFPDIDRAIEKAEDELLGQRSGSVAAIPLGDVSLLRELTPNQLLRLTPYLRSAPGPRTASFSGRAIRARTYSWSHAAAPACGFVQPAAMSGLRHSLPERCSVNWRCLTAASGPRPSRRTTRSPPGRSANRISKHCRKKNRTWRSPFSRRLAGN